MLKHLRAILSLFVLTLIVCCVLYPLALWAVGQGFFPTRANGSLIDEGGKVRGSRLIAQPFSQPKYFRPRPSAVDYKANASGGSNLAASNPLLRDRVARELGKIAHFKESKQRVGPEVQKWFLANPGTLGKWAGENKTLAKRWVTDGDNEKAVRAWLGTQKNLLPEGKELDKLSKDDVGDLGAAVLQRFAELHPTAWPAAKKQEAPGKEPTFSLAAEAVGNEDNGDLQSGLFDYWLAANPEQAERIEKVPADLVMASGSGLDPHVTLKAARYQLPDVVAARAAETKLDAGEVKRRIEKVLKAHSFRPLGVLGEPLVNVLEVNLALDEEFKDETKG
jgi:K+-transporting ATPase ATPase C chain